MNKQETILDKLNKMSKEEICIFITSNPKILNLLKETKAYTKYTISIWLRKEDYHDKDFLFEIGMFDNFVEAEEYYEKMFINKEENNYRAYVEKYYYNTLGEVVDHVWAIRELN